MTLLARVTFALLALATFGAFFVAQRLKRQPPLILRTTVVPRDFSPNGDGVRDRVRMTVRLKEADDLTVSVVGPDRDVVRELVAARPVAAREKVAVVWNGRDDAGRVPRTGFYRFRLGLGRAGRTVTVPFATRLDNRRPRPVVVRVAGRDTARVRLPLIVRAGAARPVTIRFRGSTARPARLRVVRTDLARPRIVASARIPVGRRVGTWDGRVDGAPAPPGIYRLQVAVRTRAGTVGVSSPDAPGAGVTVRGIAAQPPLVPVRARRRALVLVDARGRAYRWALRPAGSGRVAARGRGGGVRLRVRVPRAQGLYVLTLSTGTYTTRVPIVVRRPGRRRVLLVLPAFAWAGDAKVDDDGDGTPDTLGRLSDRARLERPLPSLPPLAAERGLMRRLDRALLPYDLTTDVALARGEGPGLAGASGVILPGREDWLPFGLGARLRGWVRDGGRVASFATESLRRPARLSRGLLLARGGLRPRDVFGSRIGPLRRSERGLTVFENGAGLFDTVGGLFAPAPAVEATRSAGPGEVVAAAGPDPDTRVIVAIRLGSGLVIRTGAAGWWRRLGRDPATGALTEQAWKLLAR